MKNVRRHGRKLVENLFILSSTSASLVCVPVGITGSAVSTIEDFISMALIDSYINHDEFVSVNNALREYNEIEKEIKNPKTTVEYTI